MLKADIEINSLTLTIKAHILSARTHLTTCSYKLRELAALYEDEERGVDMDTSDDAAILIKQNIIPFLNEVENKLDDTNIVNMTEEVQIQAEEIKNLKSSLLHTDKFIKSFKKWSAYEFSEYKLHDKLPSSHTERNIV